LCPELLPADIIFVDSPINVGFSYSDDPRDRVYDEATVADDLLDFMQVFLKGGNLSLIVVVISLALMRILKRCIHQCMIS